MRLLALLGWFVGRSIANPPPTATHRFRFNKTTAAPSLPAAPPQLDCPEDCDGQIDCPSGLDEINQNCFDKVENETKRSPVAADHKPAYKTGDVFEIDITFADVNYLDIRDTSVRSMYAPDQLSKRGVLVGAFQLALAIMSHDTAVTLWRWKYREALKLGSIPEALMDGKSIPLLAKASDAMTFTSLQLGRRRFRRQSGTRATLIPFDSSALVHIEDNIDAVHRFVAVFYRNYNSNTSFDAKQEAATLTDNLLFRDVPRPAANPTKPPVDPGDALPTATPHTTRESENNKPAQNGTNDSRADVAEPDVDRVDVDGSGIIDENPLDADESTNVGANIFVPVIAGSVVGGLVLVSLLVYIVIKHKDKASKIGITDSLLESAEILTAMAIHDELEKNDGGAPGTIAAVPASVQLDREIKDMETQFKHAYLVGIKTKVGTARKEEFAQWFAEDGTVLAEASKLKQLESTEHELLEMEACLFAAQFVKDFQPLVDGSISMTGAFHRSLAVAGGNKLITALRKRIGGDPAAHTAFKSAFAQTVAGISKEAAKYQVAYTRSKSGRPPALEASLQNQLARRLAAAKSQTAIALAEIAVVAPGSLPSLVRVDPFLEREAEMEAEMDTFFWKSAANETGEKDRADFEAAFKHAYLEGLQHPLLVEQERLEHAGGNFGARGKRRAAKMRASETVLDQQLATNKAALFARRFVDAQDSLHNTTDGRIHDNSIDGTDGVLRTVYTESRRKQLAADRARLLRRKDLDPMLQNRLVAQIDAAVFKFDTDDAEFRLRMRDRRMLHLRRQLAANRNSLAQHAHLGALLQNRLAANLQTVETDLDATDVHRNAQKQLARIESLHTRLADLQTEVQRSQGGRQEELAETLLQTKEALGSERTSYGAYLLNIRTEGLRNELALDQAMLNQTENLDVALKHRLRAKLSNAEASVNMINAHAESRRRQIALVALMAKNELDRDRVIASSSMEPQEKFELSKTVEHDKNDIAEEKKALGQFLRATHAHHAIQRLCADQSLVQACLPQGVAGQLTACIESESAAIKSLGESRMNGAPSLIDNPASTYLSAVAAKLATEHSNIAAARGSPGFKLKSEQINSTIVVLEILAADWDFGDDGAAFEVVLRDPEYDATRANIKVGSGYLAMLRAEVDRNKQQHMQAQLGNAADVTVANQQFSKQLDALEALLERRKGSGKSYAENLLRQATETSGVTSHIGIFTGYHAEIRGALARSGSHLAEATIEDDAQAVQLHTVRINDLEALLAPRAPMHDEFGELPHDKSLALEVALKAAFHQGTLQQVAVACVAGDSLAFQQKSVIAAKTELALVDPASALRVAGALASGGLGVRWKAGSALSANTAEQLRASLQTAYLEGMQTPEEDQSAFETRLRTARLVDIRRHLTSEREKLGKVAKKDMASKTRLLSSIQETEAREVQELATIQVQEAKVQLAASKADVFAAQFVEVLDIPGGIADTLVADNAEDAAAEEAALNIAMTTALRAAFREGARQNLAWHRDETTQQLSSSPQVQDRLAARLALTQSTATAWAEHAAVATAKLAAHQKRASIARRPMQTALGVVSDFASNQRLADARSHADLHESAKGVKVRVKEASKGKATNGRGRNRLSTLPSPASQTSGAGEGRAQLAGHMIE